MRTRGLLLVTVVLLAVAASWLAVFAPRTPTPEGNSARSGSAAAAAVHDGERTSDRTTPANVVRTEAGTAADAQFVRVHVLDARGDPVPGATVRYWPRRDDERRKQDDAWEEEHDDLEAALARSGAMATTAADGTSALDARLMDGEDGRVTARLGDLYGYAYVDAEAHDALIQVQHDIELIVAVVDAMGRGQPGLRLRLELAEVSLQGRFVGRQREENGLTDDAGRVRLRHLQLALESAPDATEQRLRIWCQRRTSDASVVTIAERWVSWDELSAETKLQLVVPTGGSIAVRVVDASGQPADAEVWLSDEAGETWQTDPVTVGDVCWFRGLPPQRRWTVTARVDAELPDATVTVRGPVSVDDVVDVDVPVPSLRRWNFLAKLARSDGLPMHEPSVRLVCPELAIDATFTGYTDAEGRLRRLWGHFPAAIAAAHHVELHVESRFVTPQVFRFDRTFGPGDNELGTLVLAPPAGERVLASVDVRGEGVSLNDTAAVNLGTADNYWALVRRRPDRIELLGTPTGEPMFLTCGCEGWLSCTRSPIAFGEHLTLDLVRAARLVVPFVAPALPLNELTAELRNLDREDREEAEVDCNARAFRWSRVPAGRYRLSIHGAGRLLHEEPELHLRAGWQHWPTTVARLDLRGRVNAHRVVARAGDPDRRLLGIETLCVAPGSNPPAGFDEQRLPEHWFLPTVEPFDLLVRAFRFVPQRLRDPRRDVALDLQPFTKIEVRATDPLAKIHVRIREDGVRDPGLLAFDTCNDHDLDRVHEGEATLWSAPGTVLEAWVVRENDPPSPETIVVGTTSPQAVTLR